MREIDDVRSWVGAQAHGMVRFMLDIQAALEDVEGAYAAGQFATVAQQTRASVLRLLWVDSMREPDGVFIQSPDWASWNPIPHATERTEAALALVEDMAAACLVQDEQAIGEHVQALRETAAAIEAGFNGQVKLPQLRGADGLFPALKLASTWLPVADAVGLPEILPDDWRVPGTS